MKYFDEKVKFVKEMNRRKEEIKYKYISKQISLDTRNDLLKEIQEELKIIENMLGKIDVDSINKHIEKESKNEKLKNISKKSVKTSSTVSSAYGLLPGNIKGQIGRIAVNLVKTHPVVSAAAGCVIAAGCVYKIGRSCVK